MNSKMKNVRKTVSGIFIAVQTLLMTCLSDAQAFMCLSATRINIPMFIRQGDGSDRSLSLVVFSLDRAAQSYSIRIISAFDQIVVISKLWLNNVQKCPGSIKVDEEMKQEIKNLGSYLQLLLQVKHIKEFICV